MPNITGKFLRQLPVATEVDDGAALLVVLNPDGGSPRVRRAAKSVLLATLNDALTAKAAVNHTHVAADITDATAAGRAVLTAADEPAQRLALGLGSIATQDADGVTITGGEITGITDLTVADGGTGRSTATAYALLAGGTTSTAAHQSLAAGATTEILVGGGASALPVWTTATGSGAPVRATSPTLVTPVLGTPSSGTLTNCTGLPMGGLLDAAVTNAKLRNSAALSVMGRSANTAGAPDDIVGADGQVLRVSGTSLGFGTIVTAGVADGVITNAKLADMATVRVKARKSGTTGPPEDCTLSDLLDFIGSAAQGDILYRDSSGWARLGAGTDGYYLRTQGAGANPIWQAVTGTTTLNVQQFTVGSGTTWSKPTGAVYSLAILIGGGGGGGSGRRSAASNAAGGGGGGGGGAVHISLVPCSYLGSTETVTVGTGGAGGAVPVGTNNGNNGTGGGSTTFSNWTAGGGQSGGGGQAASGGAAGSARVCYIFGTSVSSGGGVAGSATGVPSAPANIGVPLPTGGGGGGGMPVAGTNQNGSNGGSILFNNLFVSPPSAATGGLAAGVMDGSNGASALTAGLPFGGMGGGGGASNSAGTPGVGGNGGSYGAGGGGGGASWTGFGSPTTGGNGGDGYALILTFCI